jgi:hypothetical protein
LLGFTSKDRAIYLDISLGGVPSDCLASLRRRLTIKMVTMNIVTMTKMIPGTM